MSYTPPECGWPRHGGISTILKGRYGFCTWLPPFVLLSAGEQHSGRAHTRLEAFAINLGSCAHGGDPDKKGREYRLNCSGPVGCRTGYPVLDHRNPNEV
jgi:hypothetical protein